MRLQNQTQYLIDLTRKAIEYREEVRLCGADEQEQKRATCEIIKAMPPDVLRAFLPKIPRNMPGLRRFVRARIQRLGGDA
jgi:hypothetical protein